MPAEVEEPRGEDTRPVILRGRPESRIGAGMSDAKKIEELARRMGDALKPFNETISRGALDSSAYSRVQVLKRDFVESLFLQRGAFFEAVREVRGEWNVAPREVVPCGGERSTYWPVEHQPPITTPTNALVEFEERWTGDLRPLEERFVPDGLGGRVWEEFFGACVFCRPPADRLLDFAEFGRVSPQVFWPVGEYGDLTPGEFGLENLRAMACPPVERTIHRDPGGGKRSVEYRIVVDEHTTEADVISAYRGIKSAHGFGNPGGKPPMDRLVALQMAVIYDDLNPRRPDDRRYRRWTHEGLAAEFKDYGVNDAGSAKRHIRRGRDIRKGL